jgi:hypothetical protein
MMFTDSRAAEHDIVNVMKGEARLFFQVVGEMQFFGYTVFAKGGVMNRIIISMIAVLFVAGSLSFAEDKFIVSGELVYATEADIYVCLYNQQTFSDWKKSMPPGHYTLKVKANSSGKALFPS